MSPWQSPWRRDAAAHPGDVEWHAAIRREIGRAPRGAHVPEDTWLALARGETPPDGVTALAHVARCPECRDVLRAVRALQEGAPAAGSPRPQRLVPTGWRALAAAAAVLVVLGAGWLARRPEPSPVVTSTAPSAPASKAAPTVTGDRPIAPPPLVATAARPDWLRATPPAIALYSPGALTMRGGGNATFPDALAEALEPWRAKRYADAVRRLEPLAAAYPDAVEVPFYAGVSALLSGSPQTAVAPLRQAFEAAPPALRADAAWYLGLALLDGAQLEAARGAFADSCEAGMARGCEAARLLARSQEGL